MPTTENLLDALEAVDQALEELSPARAFTPSEYKRISIAIHCHGPLVEALQCLLILNPAYSWIPEHLFEQARAALALAEGSK